MNQLTTVAALPQAGGCMSALPAEVGEKPNKEGYFAKGVVTYATDSWMRNHTKQAIDQIRHYAGKVPEVIFYGHQGVTVVNDFNIESKATAQQIHEIHKQILRNHKASR